jgi:hypothetical protein
MRSSSGGEATEDLERLEQIVTNPPFAMSGGGQKIGFVT